MKKSSNLEESENISPENNNSEVCTNFKVDKELKSNDTITYDDELKIEKNIKCEKDPIKIVISPKENIKEYEIGKKSNNKKIVKNLKELFKEYDKIKIIAYREKVGSAFTAVKVLCKEGIAIYDEELKIKRNFKDEKVRTKIVISIRKKIKSNN